MFLFENETAVKLYETYAKDMPIFDYHCHLSEKQILENKRFNDIAEVWLGGNHYKWRLMRNYGVPEELITGGASNHDKFVAYCKTLGTAFGNPLYHWSQIELKEFFDCNFEINEQNAIPSLRSLQISPPQPQGTAFERAVPFCLRKRSCGFDRENSKD